jgi:hypothetical protein
MHVCVKEVMAKYANAPVRGRLLAVRGVQLHWHPQCLPLSGCGSTGLEADAGVEHYRVGVRKIVAAKGGTYDDPAG